LGEGPGLYVGDADGKGARRLGRVAIPRWAPDGKRLLAVNFSTLEWSLIDMETRKEQPVQLQDHKFVSVPSWVDADTVVGVIRSEEGSAIALVDVSSPESLKVKEIVWRPSDSLAVEPTHPVFDAVTRRCLFVGKNEQGAALYRVDRDGAVRRLEPG